MYWKDQYHEVTKTAIAGKQWQITFWDKWEAERGMQLYIDYLREADVNGWSVNNYFANLSVMFPSGGRVWFDSFRSTSRPSATTWFFNDDRPERGRERIF